VDAGEQKLDDPVAKYLPAFKGSSTVCQLLCHTSGIFGNNAPQRQFQWIRKFDIMLRRSGRKDHPRTAVFARKRPADFASDTVTILQKKSLVLAYKRAPRFYSRAVDQLTRSAQQPPYHWMPGPQLTGIALSEINPLMAALLAGNCWKP
jgi:hypothetical protein